MATYSLCIAIVLTFLVLAILGLMSIEQHQKKNELEELRQRLRAIEDSHNRRIEKIKEIEKRQAIMAEIRRYYKWVDMTQVIKNCYNCLSDDLITQSVEISNGIPEYACKRCNKCETIISEYKQKENK